MVYVYDGDGDTEADIDNIVISEGEQLGLITTKTSGGHSDTQIRSCIRAILIHCLLTPWPHPQIVRKHRVKILKILSGNRLPSTPFGYINNFSNF